MASDVLAEAALLALYSTAEAVTLVLFGVAARWMGYLDGYINGRLSRFCMRLANPALCLSLFTFFSAPKLVRWWPVPFVAAVHIGLGALLGRLAAAVLRLRAPHRQILIMSCGFANCGAIPFVLVVPLFQQWSRTKDDPEALSDAYSVIGLYLLAWIVLFFSVGRWIVLTIGLETRASSAPEGQVLALRTAPDPRKDLQNEDAAGSHDDRLPISEASRSPPALSKERGILGKLQSAPAWAWNVADRNVICILAAVGIGCVDPLKAQLQDGVLRWIGSVWSQLGNANIVLSTILLGSALQPESRLAIRALHSRLRGIKQQHSERAKQENTQRTHSTAPEDRDGNTTANIVAAPCTNPSFRAMDEHGDLRPEEVHWPQHQVHSSEDELLSPSPARGELPRLRIAVAIILLKLIVMPAICIPVQELSAQAGILVDDPVLLVVLHMMSGLPSSLSLVVLLLSTGQRSVAEQVGSFYLPEYLVAIVSIALVTTIAITLQTN